MAIDKLQFTKDWNSSTDFPTVETDETAVRRDMQLLHDETKNYLNGKVVPALDSVRNDLDAALREQDSTRHTHANKALLDTYTQTEADLKRAVEEAHEHENKDVLDGIAGVTQSLGDATDKVPSEAAVSKAIALAGGIPGGGVTGQVLVKASDAAMDTQWDTMTADRVGAVKKTGDTMTGNLTVERASYPQIHIKQSTVGSRVKLQNSGHSLMFEISPDSTDTTRRSLIVADSVQDASIQNAVQFAHTSDGKTTLYPIFHAGNKELISFSATATVGTNWTASGDYFYQDITVSGLLATDAPIVDINPGSDNAANLVYADCVGKVFRATASANSLRMWATEAISTAFPIQLKVVR